MNSISSKQDSSLKKMAIHNQACNIFKTICRIMQEVSRLQLVSELSEMIGHGELKNKKSEDNLTEFKNLQNYEVYHAYAGHFDDKLAR